MKPRTCAIAAIALACSMAACAASHAPDEPVSSVISQPIGSLVEKALGTASAGPTPEGMRTRHATYTRAGFDELPGWEQDDVLAGWPAFRNSCTVLQRRVLWREVCTQSAGVARTPAAIRAFFESRFALLRILGTDAGGDGDITGYFEPLLEGRRQPQGDFNVPVIGVPRDLYTLDWIDVPAAQRRSIVHVKPRGNALVVTPAAEPGSVALDLSRFDLDTKDRRLRIRLSRDRGTLIAEAYPTRGELAALGMPSGVDAPVLAWVKDALGLYAMQIQGSGRIGMPDATVLRVNYADQNGHPFKPLRVVAKASDRVVTRGVGSASTNDVDQLVLEDDSTTESAAADRVRGDNAEAEAVRTRGIVQKRPSAASAGQSQDAAVDAMVEALLRAPPKRLLGTAPAAAESKSAAVVSQARPSEVASPARISAAALATPSAFDPSRLSMDPSYVFFKVSADQTPIPGPPGAMGVPLTPGRSVAVDPRVTPLGYPVFLSAPAPQGSNIEMRRLVFAQDTGGAIRGAVRADFFWGFGSDAGRLARGTRHRGQMWLLMPKAEVTRLAQAGVVTRGISSTSRAGDECLVADDAFCQEPD